MHAVNGLATAAIGYAHHGWHVVPLYSVDNGTCTCSKGRDCPSPGKHPRLNNWQDHATDDPETVERWFTSDFPASNVGVRLGRVSGILDIECDDAEAEETLLVMFGGEFPHTPTYKSSRGKHRLFRWRDGLPHADKNGFKIGKLEFRTGNGDRAAQSVFPPSVHQSGRHYEWIIHPDDAEPLELSEALVARIWNSLDGDLIQAQGAGRPNDQWLHLIRNGAGQGSRNLEATALVGRMLADLRDVTDQAALVRTWEFLKLWNRCCEPPQHEDAVWATFCSVQRREQAKRAVSPASVPDTSPLDDSKPGAFPEWRSERVDSDPPVWRVWSPLWSLQAPHGYVELSHDQLHDTMAIVKAVSKQANVPLNPKVFGKVWWGDAKTKTPSQWEALVKAADRVEPAHEMKRHASLAAAMLRLVYSGWSRVVAADKHPPADGNPVRLESGEIAFLASYFEREFRNQPGMGKKEIFDLLREIGASSPDSMRKMGPRGKRLRYRILDSQAISQLKQLAGIEDDIEAATEGS